MKYLAAALAFATAVAGHGYVNNATIGNKAYTFYQPYQDPYMSPPTQRISRAIQGNGPVEDVTSPDLQCGGYTAGGIVGSKPAALHAEVAAGSQVDLYWTLWPDSHVGPTVTYMAKCPDAGCNNYMPNNTYVWSSHGAIFYFVNNTAAPSGSKSSKPAAPVRPTPGALVFP